MVQWWDSLGQVDVWSWGSWRSFPTVMVLWILWSYSLLLLVYRGNRINPNHNPRIFILTVLPNFSSWWMYDNLWRWSVLKILNKVLWKKLEFRLQPGTEQLILEESLEEEDLVRTGQGKQLAKPFTLCFVTMLHDHPARARIFIFREHTLVSAQMSPLSRWSWF